jgi:VanZ family protein
MTPQPDPKRSPWIARLLAAATAAFTALLVVATHYPRPEELLGPNPPSDKTLHFVAYGMLAALAAATWLTSRRLAGKSLGGLAVALAAFGGLDELTQPFFRRSAEPLDWLYDCAGIVIGIAAVATMAAILRGLRRPTSAAGQ